MIDKTIRDLILSGEIEIPNSITNKLQNIVDNLSEVLNVPSALIMFVNPPNIEVYRTNKSEKNPFENGQIYKLTGLYCEEVIKSKKKLLVPNALKDNKWDQNPDLEYGMISYLGFPILCPDDSVFGTICVSDTKENEYNLSIESIMVQYKNLIELNLDLIYRNYQIKKSLKEYQEKGIEMEEKVKNLEQNQILFADRELMMYDLQNEVDNLRRKLGLTPKYQ